ncbi:HB2L protein, partial [Pitta sordida]|nr:HB2L protein [Pitta sordida]
GHPLTCVPAHSGVFQEMMKYECHFINGTDRVRFVARAIYNREQQLHFDSDVREYVGDNPLGEKVARDWNSDLEMLEHARTQVDKCRYNYKLSTPFLVNSRVEPPAQPQLCSVMDFYPKEVQVRWFQDGKEVPEHVVATDVIPNGDWTYQLLVMLEIRPRHGVTYTCQVKRVSLEQPLS